MAFKIKSLTRDAKKVIKGKFNPSRAAELKFQKALRKVAQVSGHIIDNYADGVTLKDKDKMQAALKSYSDALTPWAERQSARLLDQVQRSNKRAYQQKSKAMGSALKFGVGDKEVGQVARALQNEQVALIKSIPIEAGLRAQKIASDAFFEGLRAQPDQSVIDRLTKEMGMTTEVATNRAKLIAVTETARANATINQARATAVGSTSYRWHNSGDGAVRESHKVYKGKRMQGQVFRWDSPPTLDDGMTGHPGTFPRCRCFAEPIFETE